MILSLIYQAFILILLLTFSFGPAFFALINTGIKFGYHTGSFLALGVVLSDLFVCILVCLLVYFGMSNLLDSKTAQTVFATIGGGILIGFGLYFFKKHEVKTEETIDLENQPPSPHVMAENDAKIQQTVYVENQLPKPRVMVLKGFVLNLFNPSVWLLWLTNVTVTSKTVEYSIIKMLIFFVLVLAAVLGVELFKVKLSGKIKHYLTDKVMNIVNYITGTALIIFGAFLIYNHYFNKN